MRDKSWFIQYGMKENLEQNWTSNERNVEEGFRGYFRSCPKSCGYRNQRNLGLLV